MAWRLARGLARRLARGLARWSLLGSSLLGPSLCIRLARWLRLAPLLVVISTKPVDYGQPVSV